MTSDVRWSVKGREILMVELRADAVSRAVLTWGGLEDMARLSFQA